MTQPFHIIRNNAVQHLNGYNIEEAIAISLEEDEYKLAHEIQQNSPLGKTLKDEYTVAENALKAASIPADVIEAALNYTREYFIELGHDENTLITPA